MQGDKILMAQKFFNRNDYHYFHFKYCQTFTAFGRLRKVELIISSQFFLQRDDLLR